MGWGRPYGLQQRPPSIPTNCSPDVEIQWLKLVLPRTRPTFIANVYRPPSGNLEIALNLIESKLINIHGQNPGDIVILGDMNVDMLAKNDPKTVKYKSFIKSVNLSQLIDRPTRYGVHKASLIDHCLTNREDYYHLVGTLETGLSDHDLIFVSRKKKKIPRTIGRLKCRNYRKLNESNFQAHI